MTAPEPPTTPSACSRRAVIGAAGAGSALLLSACGGDAPEAAGAATAGAPVDAGPVEDVPVGSAVKIDQDGVRAVVGRPAPDTVVAFSPECPHQGCMVAPGEERYVCPCHSSQFDLATGEVLSGPAEAGLEPRPVRVEGGRILLG